jgi:hypothetical protein
MRWLDATIDDVIWLPTSPQATKYLVASLRAQPGVTVMMEHPEGVVIDYEGRLAALATNRFFAAAVLRESSFARSKTIAAMAADGPVRFSAASRLPDRAALVKRLEAEYGWVYSPAGALLHLFRDDYDLCAQIVALDADRRIGPRPSTHPVFAAIAAQMLLVQPGHAVLDPFCGTGQTLAAVDALAAPRLLIGVDRHPGAGHDVNRDRVAIMAADAGALPIATRSVDRVIGHLPADQTADGGVLLGFLRELDRVLILRGRAVLLSQGQSGLRSSLAQVPTLRLVNETSLRLGRTGLTACVVTSRSAKAAAQSP